ncbi:type II toxin-antitoxin system RatA family toxin [Nocardia sp. NPDC003482]
MRTLELKLFARNVNADTAFERISRFESYPALVEEVRAVTVRQDAPNTPLHSDWEVYFRNGPLKWSEVDYFQHNARRIVFEQTSGDFEVFRGSWAVDEAPEGCEVRFETTFDFGIPSMAGVLEPIATRVLKEGIAIIVHRLLGRVEVVDDPQVAAAVALRLADRDAERLSA